VGTLFTNRIVTRGVVPSPHTANADPDLEAGQGDTAGDDPAVATPSADATISVFTASTTAVATAAATPAVAPLATGPTGIALQASTPSGIAAAPDAPSGSSSHSRKPSRDASFLDFARRHLPFSAPPSARQVEDEVRCNIQIHVGYL